MGYLLKWTEGGAKIELEADTISCSHCQKVLLKNRWKKQGAWCWRCGHAICSMCDEKSHVTGCVPFMQMIEAQLRRNKLLEEV